jgi:hypothetical protein
MRSLSMSALTRGFVVAVMGASALAWQPHAARAISPDPQGRLDMPFSRPDAEITARRLYLALLNREPDQRGLEETAADLQRGNLRGRVRQIVQSPEFRERTASLPVTHALEQMHRGLLNRPPDAAAVTDHIAAMEARQYAEVTLRLIDTAEYRQQLAEERRSPPARRPVDQAPPIVDTPPRVPSPIAAVSCQEQVVERIRVELPGLVLLRFEPAEVAGGVTSGVAFDVLDRNRRLTYSCDRAVTYRYDDRRADRRVPFEAAFADAAVRQCHDAIRDKLLRERGPADAVFESAGIMPMASAESIRGVGVETRRTGRGGATFHYQCEVAGDVVRTTRYRFQ